MRIILEVWNIDTVFVLEQVTDVRATKVKLSLTVLERSVTSRSLFLFQNSFQLVRVNFGTFGEGGFLDQKGKIFAAETNPIPDGFSRFADSFLNVAVLR